MCRDLSKKRIGLFSLLQISFEQSEVKEGIEKEGRYFAVFRVVRTLVEEGHFVPAKLFEDGGHRFGDLRVRWTSAGERGEELLVWCLVVRAKLKSNQEFQLKCSTLKALA